MSVVIEGVIYELTKDEFRFKDRLKEAVADALAAHIKSQIAGYQSSLSGQLDDAIGNVLVKRRLEKEEDAPCPKT